DRFATVAATGASISTFASVVDGARPPTTGKNIVPVKVIEEMDEPMMPPPVPEPPVQPAPESIRSAQARRATVKAPPEEVCFTTCELPPVVVKSVVPAGNVSVFVPATAGETIVSVPEDEPGRRSFVML